MGAEIFGVLSSGLRFGGLPAHASASGGGELSVVGMDIEVQSVQDVGILRSPRGIQRDGGGSALVGDKVLWVFGDTVFAVPAADEATYRSNTAALSDPRDPLVMTEPLGAHGDPYQFIPFTPSEEAYNERSGRPDERIAIWPARIIPDGPNGAFVFYYKLKVHPGRLNLEMVGTGIAYAGVGESTAVRYPGLLFRRPQIAFAGGVVVGPYLYAYGCSRADGLRFSCAVARVEKCALTDRNGYRFWNGRVWAEDIREARPVLDGPTGSFSISWNGYLQEYIAVYSEPFSNHILMRTADRPEGPWSLPVLLFKGRAPGIEGAYDYAGREHLELATQEGRAIFVTYARPVGFLRVDIHLVRVVFRARGADAPRAPSRWAFGARPADKGSRPPPSPHGSLIAPLKPPRAPVGPCASVPDRLTQPAAPSWKPPTRAGSRTRVITANPLGQGAGWLGEALVEEGRRLGFFLVGAGGSVISVLSATALLTTCRWPRRSE